MWAAPAEILVTVGAQHALFLLATLLVGTATTVGVEDPGYPDARNIFASRTPSVVVLPLTFIASLWGMNVGVPGEQSIAAFWIIVGIMIGMLAGMIAFFRYRGWL